MILVDAGCDSVAFGFLGVEEEVVDVAVVEFVAFAVGIHVPAVADDADVAVDGALGVDLRVGGVDADDGVVGSARIGAIDEGVVLDRQVADGTRLEPPGHVALDEDGAHAGLIVGVVGGVLGGWLFSLIGISAGGIIGSLITSVVGAIVLLWLVGLLSRASHK